MLKFSLFGIILILSINCCFSLSFLKKHLFKQAYDRIKKDRLLLKSSGSHEEWIEQKLDNFHSTDDRTWYQRYFVREDLSRPNGPVFLQIGGEGPASAVWMNNGHWIEMARNLNALCFQLEHRFYGLSQPTKDVSLKNLAYLSSEQALADLSNFISTMNKKHSLGNRKWIVFGGSYPGSLALWARLKYPHLISGAVSASAPLNAELDFSTYNQVVYNSLNNLGHPECAANLQQASEHLSQLLNSGKYATVFNDFQLCELPNTFDVQYLQQSLADNIADVVQYNRDARQFEDSKRKIMDISELCDLMDTDHSELNYRNYAVVIRTIMKFNNISCMDGSYLNYLSEMRNSSWAAAPSAREWVYQTCSEFGWYQTASSDVKWQPFRGFPLSFFVRECKLLFDINEEEIKRAVKRTNIMYGNIDVVQQITNATLYNGIIDPWANVSYTGQLHQKSKVGIEVVEDTAHCAVMYPPSDQDSLGLVKARKQIEVEVYKWLGIEK